jgi:hypothetical protein
MRIDLLKIADKFQFQEVSDFYSNTLNELQITINEPNWNEFKKTLKCKPKIDELNLFSTIYENRIACNMQ